MRTCRQTPEQTRRIADDQGAEAVPRAHRVDGIEQPPSPCFAITAGEQLPLRRPRRRQGRQRDADEPHQDAPQDRQSGV